MTIDISDILVDINQFGVEIIGNIFIAIFNLVVRWVGTAVPHRTQHTTISARTCRQSHIELNFPVNDDLLNTLNCPDVINPTQQT